MRSAPSRIVLIAVVLMGTGWLFAQEKAPQRVLDLAQNELTKLGTNPVILAAVRAENAKARNIDQIRKMDEQYMMTQGNGEGWMKDLTRNNVAKELKRLVKTAPYYLDFIVMDRLGATVGSSERQSNFYKGHEDRFTKSYTGGNGTVFVTDVVFDEGAQTYLVQVSVPIVDAGNAIGVVCISVDIDKVR